MIERAEAWYAVADIDNGFGSLTYTFDGRVLTVEMIGERTLCMEFGNVSAVRFEDECPGFDPLPSELPLLSPGVTFPLLRISGSRLLQQHSGIRGFNRAHFALITSDYLLQVIADPDVQCTWRPHRLAQQAVQPDRA